MELYGRDEELACLRLALREAVPGDAWITVVGGPGIGKRALVRRALLERTALWVDASQNDLMSMGEKLRAWAASDVACVVFERLDTWAYEDVAQLADALGQTRISAIALMTRPFGFAMETQLRLGPLRRDAAVQMLEDGLARAGASRWEASMLHEVAERLQCLPRAIAVATPRMASVGPELVRDAWILDALSPHFERLLMQCSDAEKRALRVLALFEKGVPTRLAEAVLAGEGADIAGTLHALVSASLLQRTKEGRFALFPWLRAYVQHHVAFDSEDDARAAWAFLRAAPQGGDARRKFASDEYANLVGLASHAQASIAVAALAQLRWAWLTRLRLAEGVAMTTRVLGTLEEGSLLWLEALLLCVQLRYGQGEGSALIDADRAIEAAAQLGRRDLEGAAHVWRVTISALLADPTALSDAARCHDVFGAALDAYHRARLGAVRGYLALRARENVEARRCFRDAVQQSQLDGDFRLACDAWCQSAWLAASCGETKEARFAVGEALRCEQLAGLPHPHLNRVLADSLTLVMERRAGEVDAVIHACLEKLPEGVVFGGVLRGVQGVARFAQGEFQAAQRCLEEACASPDERRAVRAYWLYWLALTLSALGANVTARDTFYSALEITRTETEMRDEMLELASLFALRVLGLSEASRCIPEHDANEAARLLRARVVSGHGSAEGRLALMVLGYEEAVVRTLRVQSDTTSIDLEGVQVTLALGSPQRAVLCALLDAHHRHPGKATSMDELIDAAWPGETLVGDSGPNRLRVAVSRLRKLGLGEIVVSHPGGYALVHPLEVEFLRTPEVSRNYA